MSNDAKPVLWIHKHSGRIRFEGEGLPSTWTPLYAKEEVKPEPKKYYHAAREAMRLAIEVMEQVDSKLSEKDYLMMGRAIEELRFVVEEPHDTLMDCMLSFLLEAPGLDDRHPMFTEGYRYAIEHTEAYLRSLCKSYGIEVSGA